MWIRYRANTRLQGQAANLLTAERLLKVGFWQIDAAGALTWSDTMFDLYGVTRETFTPTTANVIALMHPDDLEMMRQGAASSRQAGGVTQAFTFRTRRPDGEIVWLRGVSDFAMSPDGPVAVSYTHLDVYKRQYSNIRRAKSLTSTMQRDSRSNIHAGSGQILTKVASMVPPTPQTCRKSLCDEFKFVSAA